MIENSSLPGPEARSAIISKFAFAYDYFLGNDVITLGHSQRCGKVGRFVCDMNGIYFSLPPEEAEYSLFIHDIGKMTIPGYIIKSREKYEAGSPEWEIINKHPQNGSDIVWNLPKSVRDLVLYHHERWDGDGYPFEIKGGLIPEVARFMAIIDALDAIMSERSYKKGETLAKALKIIKAGAGSQFDPNLVEMVVNTIQKGGALVDDLFLRYYPLSIR
jgi:HD-GYP domain-containing protein (c-di-GMP phosphodiesterase class II)